MGILNFNGFALLYVLFAWLVGVTVGAVVLSVLLRPLDAPSTTRKSRWAEIFLIIIVGCFLFTLFLKELAFVLIIALVFFLIYWGPILILLGIALWLILRKSNPSQEPQKPVRLQYSLMELVTMLLAIGFSPVIMSMLYSDISTATTLIVALSVGLVLYKKALYRLNSNHIPFGTTRTAFLLVYPYMYGLRLSLFFCPQFAAHS